MFGMEERWTAVDAYTDARLIGSDPILDEAMQASAAAGLPPIAVTPSQGKLLFVLAKAIRATRILEIGTLGGYSGIWLARALPPHGRLITLEADPQHAQVAQQNFARAGVSSLVDLRVGDALEVLSQLAKETVDPLDFVFIDADKTQYAEYLEGAVGLCRPGALIVADNIVRRGALVDEMSADVNVQGVRRFLDRVNADARLTATVIQTVGAKGYDGMAVILVTGRTTGHS